MIYWFCMTEKLSPSPRDRIRLPIHHEGDHMVEATGMRSDKPEPQYLYPTEMRDLTAFNFYQFRMTALAFNLATRLQI